MARMLQVAVTAALAVACLWWAPNLAAPATEGRPEAVYVGIAPDAGQGEVKCWTERARVKIAVLASEGAKEQRVSAEMRLYDGFPSKSGTGAPEPLARYRTAPAVKLADIAGDHEIVIPDIVGDLASSAAYYLTLSVRDPKANRTIEARPPDRGCRGTAVRTPAVPVSCYLLPWDRSGRMIGQEGLWTHVLVSPRLRLRVEGATDTQVVVLGPGGADEQAAQKLALEKGVRIVGEAGEGVFGLDPVSAGLGAHVKPSVKGVPLRATCIVVGAKPEKGAWSCTIESRLQLEAGTKEETDLLTGGLRAPSADALAKAFRAGLFLGARQDDRQGVRLGAEPTEFKEASYSAQEKPASSGGFCFLVKAVPAAKRAPVFAWVRWEGRKDGEEVARSPAAALDVWGPGEGGPPTVSAPTTPAPPQTSSGGTKPEATPPRAAPPPPAVGPPASPRPVAPGQAADPGAGKEKEQPREVRAVEDLKREIKGDLDQERFSEAARKITEKLKEAWSHCERERPELVSWRELLTWLQENRKRYPSLNEQARARLDDMEGSLTALVRQEAGWETLQKEVGTIPAVDAIPPSWRQAPLGPLAELERKHDRVEEYVRVNGDGFYREKAKALAARIGDVITILRRPQEL